MTEVELKFAVDRASRARLARCPPLAGVRPVRRRVWTLYFDTPDGEIARNGMALRLRRVDGRWIQGLKAGKSGRGGLHAREEWEFDRDGPGIDLAAFAATPLARLRDAGRLHERLAPVFEVDFVRTAWTVAPRRGSRLEVALDVGRVATRTRSEPIAELEIECLEAGAGAAFDFALALLRHVRLRPSAVTKAQRGYRLLRGTPPLPARTKPVALRPSLTPLEAARAVIGPALEQLQANEDGLLRSDDPEFVHQARVALRRMRSALRIFRAAIGRDRARAWREALGGFAAALGGARDWDVFAHETLPPALAACRDAALARRLQARADRRRAGERAAARRALASPAHARVVLELARWLAGAEPPSAGTSRAPLAPFATRVLRKRHKRLLAGARRLASLDAEGRHRVRIDAKRLRYAVDGLASVFESRRVKRYRRALAGLQDQLGTANDAVSAARLVAALDPPAAFAAFARDWYAARARLHPRRIERLVDRLARRGPPVPREAKRSPEGR